MISVTEAESVVLKQAHPASTEWVDLSAASGRVLACNVDSPQDFPPAATSSMDGYAVRHADLATIPTELTVVETLPAGTVSQATLQSGQAARLFTGSELPSGADTISIQENAERLSPDLVRILAPSPKGQFVRQPGQYCQMGDRLMSVGQVLGAPEIAVLAAVRRLNVPVFRRIRVGIVSTGDELVSPDCPPGPGQIVDSNQPGLSALVQQAGGIPQRLGIVKDTETGTDANQPGEAEKIAAGEAVLKRAISSALSSCDVILSSGGVSVGDYDRVEAALEDMGAQIHIRKVAIKPGKPFTFATLPQIDAPPKLYFGLPGNPVSAMVCFWRFVLPALKKMQGEEGPWAPCFPTAIAQSSLTAGGQRETYLWGRVGIQGGQLQFTAANEHGSGNLINLAGTNALAILPVGTQRIKRGQPVSVLLTQPLMG